VHRREEGDPESDDAASPACQPSHHVHRKRPTVSCPLVRASADRAPIKHPLLRLDGEEVGQEECRQERGTGMQCSGERERRGSLDSRKIDYEKVTMDEREGKNE
jgi:hypothetical protein